jgi:phospholipase C
VEVPVDPPSSIRGGEAFLARIYDAIRSAASPDGSNAYNTTFFIGWDEPGGTYDHVPPGPVPPPDPGDPTGQMGFKFDRSGYRVPPSSSLRGWMRASSSTRSTGTRR